jgi:hypothetical protein
MDAVTLGVIGLRGAALGLNLQGQATAANQLYLLADAIEAGENVDEHMKIVAEKLKDRNSNDSDWSDVAARIAAHSDELQTD